MKLHTRSNIISTRLYYDQGNKKTKSKFQKSNQMDCFPHFFPLEELRAELILCEKDVLRKEIVQTASIHQEWVSIFQHDPDQRLAR